MTEANILCVDDEQSSLVILEDGLQRAGHRTVGVRNVQAALTVLGRGGIDLVVSDYRMPETTGIEFLAAMDREGVAVPLIMITGYGSIEHAVASIKAGAIDYITKPVRAEQLELAVNQALEFTRLKAENAELRKEVGQIRSSREIVGASTALARIMETVRTVAPTRATVLFEGESGTGKEMLARTLHNLSDRRDGPFVPINCAALPENLVESTLFGHEKGAFTGAIKQSKGAFERAHRGTLLLDEVSEMRPELQAKLLRVLQEQEFERVGGSSPVTVDVRVVATTNRDLAEAVAQGEFREDLYFRLAVVPILVPPLRDRLDDVPALLSFFALRAAKDVGRTIDSISSECIPLLRAYSWPGNLREFKHAVERAVILSPSGELTPENFERERFGLAPRIPSRHATSDGARNAVDPSTLNIGEMEEILIQKALEATGDNRTQAARLLGISVRTLRAKLNKPS